MFFVSSELMHCFIHSNMYKLLALTKHNIGIMYAVTQNANQKVGSLHNQYNVQNNQIYKARIIYQS